jgi:hypothetical protein
MISPVRSTDRVRDVIGRDLRLIDVFVSFSPHFERLRNPVMRRVVAGVVTVEQVATIAGVEPDTVVHALNAALGIEPTTSTHAPQEPMTATNTTSRDAAQRRPTDRIVTEVDVRDDLRAGREPFGRIMSAVRTVGDDVLRIRATFEPVPLVSVLGQRGLECETEEHGPDDWSLWAWRGAPAPVMPGPVATAAAAQADGGPRDDEMWLDVRGLEPPEPMARTLVALESLPPGVTLVQVNVRIPQFLLPVLDERGFTYEIEDGHADRVLVRIRRAS